MSANYVVKALGLSSLLLVQTILFLPLISSAQTPVTPPASQTPATSPDQDSPASANQSEVDVISPIIVEPLCTGASLDLTSNCDEFLATSTSGGDINNLVTNFINTLSLLVGIVAVIMIMVGGFRYIISGGDNSGVSAAKNTILYAIIGLIIVVFAQVIVRFVLRTVTTVN